MEWVIGALLLLPLAFLIFAFKPLLLALSQLRWVTCPRCARPARFERRRGWTKLYRCGSCGVLVARRWTRGWNVRLDVEGPGA